MKLKINLCDFCAAIQIIYTIEKSFPRSAVYIRLKLYTSMYMYVPKMNLLYSKVIGTAHLGLFIHQAFSSAGFILTLLDP